LTGSLYYFGFEILTAMVVKISVFWGRTPCNPFKVIRRFGRTSPPSSRLKSKEVRNQYKQATSKANPENGDCMFLRNVS
jgi:hypothetical protein